MNTTTTTVPLLGLLITMTSCTQPPEQPDAASAQPTARDAPSTATAPAEDPSIERSNATVDPAVLARGEAAFAAGMCNKCHAADGSGGDRGPDLTDDEWLHCDGSAEGIVAVLRSGVSKEELADPSRPFKMNPATNLVAESELEALAEFVRSLSAG